MDMGSKRGSTTARNILLMIFKARDRTFGRG